MPYEWVTHPDTAPEISGAVCASGRPDGPPLAELHAWPYRSLPRKGFVIFIGVTAGLLALPLLAVLGSVILWALLPFLMIAVVAVWWALAHSYRTGEVLEEMRIWSDRVELIRHDPKAPARHWQANPYWVSPEIHAKGGPVEQYLTLKGGPRVVELGAFLTPAERLRLRRELAAALACARKAVATP
ncbi:DUF2244 domain-containing protein [Pontitalea aquivivens]|uniref:DUF2244 domain-containing protein n=1 Tax=Pontitalea aquivivens TaxID=3388663 RepID=UPI003970A376